MGQRVVVLNKAIFIAILSGIASFSVSSATDVRNVEHLTPSLSKNRSIEPVDLANDDQFWKINRQYALGQYDKAWVDYHKALQSNKCSEKLRPYYMAESANCQQQLHKFKDALKSYQSVLKLGNIPDNLRARCLHNCGLILEMHNQPNQAVNYYHKSILYSGTSRILQIENNAHIALCLKSEAV